MMKMDDLPPRGFPKSEYESRTARAQRQMAAAQLDAILLTAAADISYFSGFITRFWQSPSRPWFLLLPAEGKPVAVIPEIGYAGMAATWLDDIRCWPSPRPHDEGISLLSALLQEVGGRFGQIGMPLGAENVVRMPMSDFLKLRESSPPIVDCGELLRDLRMLKSPTEVAKINHAARLSAAAFTSLPQDAAGDSRAEREYCRLLQTHMWQNGIDDIPYVAAASGTDGYDTVIMPPGDKTPAAGEILMIDIGAVFDEYFCDFNRNYAIGHATAAAESAHCALYRALQAGAAATRPGATPADIWQAMRAEIPTPGDIGRMGHGIGLQLTEPPSIAPDVHVPLQCGMVLALEPSMTVDGGQLVREENIVIVEDGAQWLGIPADEELPVIQ